MIQQSCLTVWTNFTWNIYFLSNQKKKKMRYTTNEQLETNTQKCLSKQKSSVFEVTNICWILKIFYSKDIFFCIVKFFSSFSSLQEEGLITFLLDTELQVSSPIKQSKIQGITAITRIKLDLEMQLNAIFKNKSVLDSDRFNVIMFLFFLMNTSHLACSLILSGNLLYFFS